jgi:hypothetical protein
MEAKKHNRGGARPGAGRPRGSSDRISIKNVIGVLARKTGGQTYEELLIDDFLQARQNQDGNLAQKYHQLLSNKLFADLQSIEVNEAEDVVAQKQAAFQEALRKLTKFDDSTK